MSKALDKAFGGLPDPVRADLREFNHKGAHGFIIRWAKKGVGFGEITVVRDKHSGEWRIDTETMGPDFVAEAIRAVGRSGAGR